MSDPQSPNEFSKPVESESPTPIDPQPGPAPMMKPSTGGGMGLRLGIILGIFILFAGGIAGTRFYLEAQLPKEDPNVKRPAVDENTDMGSMRGGGAIAPGA
ncbi:MAG: hypothetical protein AAFN77_03980 [Planctomycetota bacterium]